MNLYQAMDFFKKMYPNKPISFEFDEKCHRVYEIMMIDGIPSMQHHCECNEVKVNVDGMDSIYIPINPHRMNFSNSEIKKMLNSKDDVYIHPEYLKNLVHIEEAPEHFNQTLKDLCEMSGLSEEKVLEKLKLLNQ